MRLLTGRAMTTEGVLLAVGLLLAAGYLTGTVAAAQRSLLPPKVEWWLIGLGIVVALEVSVVGSWLAIRGALVLW